VKTANNPRLGFVQIDKDGKEWLNDMGIARLIADSKLGVYKPQRYFAPGVRDRRIPLDD